MSQNGNVRYKDNGTPFGANVIFKELAKGELSDCDVW